MNNELNRRTAPVSAPMGEELPALPKRACLLPGVYAYRDEHMMKYARTAIAPYAERIRVLERDLAERKTTSIDTPEFRSLADSYADAEHGIAMGFGEAVKDRDERLVKLIAYIDGRTAGAAPESAKRSTPNTDADSTHDLLYEKAVMIVRAHNRASLSLVQRSLVIGYNRIARLFEAMEANGVVSPCDEKGRRTVLAAAPTPMNSGKEEGNG
jgi:DNA segregation ATPase FtsK/SpoIIIE-like protein